MLDRIACVVLMIVVAGCSGSDSSSKPVAQREASTQSLALDGAAIRVEVESVPLCVGRRYVEPVQLKALLAKKVALVQVGSNTSASVGWDFHLQLFGDELLAADDELYARLAEAGMNKRRYPEDWVRLTFISQRVAAARTRDLSRRLEPYEAASFIDREFRTHRRHQDCPGQKAGAGCCMGIEQPAECVDYTLRYGHPSDPDAVLMCTTRRCYTDSPLSHSGVHYQFDFPIRMLDRWPRLHADIQSRIEQWQAAAQVGPACP